MNAVEIEEAISKLAERPFDAEEFPFAFLQAFGNNNTTIKRLRSGISNHSDIGGVLQHKNIHIKVCSQDEAGETLTKLKDSPTTSRAKAKYVLSTDGQEFHAEDLNSGEIVVCDYSDFPDHFGFFLPLAGITTVKKIRENSLDIKATGRLNRLYIELLENNPDWGTAGRRDEMNHFMAKLIFCFFAEDTEIFNGQNLFTSTIDQMSDWNSSNTHEVIGEVFRAMSTQRDDKVRKAAGIPRWADVFPYVNGGLFAGTADVPYFTRIARSYFMHIGKLDWQRINPDIFGSMIQAVADDEERGALGMHYTSVPNILKVLNPLFLDNLREKLDEAGDNSRKLLNLRNRMKRIRVFDPACGSGNFLVIAYKEMRAIEAKINERRREKHLKSEIPLTNFRGIELRHFSAEIARLALIIAEFQCDVLYRGHKDALKDFLPLDAMNWITCGNALRLEWLDICPPTGTSVKIWADDLFDTLPDQPEIDFQNEGGETYICGNPPYRGSTWQYAEQKADLEQIFKGRVKQWRSLDYVAGWFLKAADYGTKTESVAAFVSTNSICQGQQVPILWSEIYSIGHEIAFAHISFKWTNLASHNAGVTVIIVGISSKVSPVKKLFSLGEDGRTVQKASDNINPYLVAGPNTIITKVSKSICGLAEMSFGNKPVDGGNLLLTRDEVAELGLTSEQSSRFIRRIMGSAEFIRGLSRYCLWIEDKHLDDALEIPMIRKRIEAVRVKRLASRDSGANKMAQRAHQFREMNFGTRSTIIVPIVSSESRDYLPVGYVLAGTIISNLAFALYDAPLWSMALIASRLHLVWIATVCGKLETRYRYSNTLGWNTFPVPTLTQKNRADLTRTAEDILLAREVHFPATIADLYDSEEMPENLRVAHARNDEVLERIYIGRRFKNNTERLERLFAMYAKMVETPSPDRRVTGTV